MRVRLWILSLCLALLGGFLKAWARAVQPDQWVTFRHDYQRTGHTHIIGPQTLDVIKWKKPVASDSGLDGRVIGSSPVVGSDGSVYVSGLVQADDGISTALASFSPSGDLHWRQSLGQGQTDSSPSLAYGDDTVYIGTPGGVSSYTRNGISRWKSFQPSTTVWATPALSSDGKTVYTGARPLDATPGDLFFALDTINFGKTVWTTPQSFGPILSPAAVGPDGTLYFGTQDGLVIATNPADGTIKWSFDAGGAVPAAPSLGDDNTLYFGTIGSFDDPNGVMYAVDAATGLQKWANTDAGGPYFSSAALGFDGNVYIGNNDGFLYAFTPQGKLAWTFDTGDGGNEPRDGVYSSPAVGGDGTIYFGCVNGVLYAVGADGKKKSKYQMADRIEIESSPAIGPDGTLYIGAFDGYLYAFKARDPLIGDLNLNGRVDIGDAQLALRLAVDTSKVTPELLLIGDVYPPPINGGPRGNHKIDITDVILILRYVVGLEKSL